MVAPTATISGLALATLALHVRDPHEDGSWGMCPSAALGFWCPGCGGLRAVNDLTNGDVGGALSSNVVLVVLMPVAVVGLAIWAIDRWRGTSRQVPWSDLKPAVTTLLVVLTVFTVARNLAFGAWLAP
jgi:Protein of unknown function (DUF2752)